MQGTIPDNFASYSLKVQIPIDAFHSKELQHSKKDSHLINWLYCCLQEFHIQGNNFTGTLPSSLVKQSALTSLRLDDTRLRYIFRVGLSQQLLPRQAPRS